MRLSKIQSSITVADREKMSSGFYVSVVGFLMYVMLCIRFDINFVISLVGRY